MELNKFTIGLILVVLVVFVGAIAASEEGAIQKVGIQANTTESVWALNFGVHGYNNESNVAIGAAGNSLLAPNEATAIIGKIG